jgi:hypothetical protein
MTLRYDSFLTPFVSPALGRIDVSALERAGQSMSDRAKYEQARLDRLAQEAKKYELDKSETEGRNKYWDMQAETHRLSQEQARGAATEKRASVLFDSFRKAKTPVERRAVMDELQRLGYDVQEQETELPAEPTPAAEVAPTQPGPPATTPGKTPKPNKGFMSALGQIVSSENAQEAPVDESQLGKGTLASVLGIPGAEAMSGEASGASAAGEIAAPTAPTRGGRFVIKDKSGAVVHSYDEPLERMKSQMAIKGALGAMGVTATNDRERNAVQAASVAGANMLDLGLPPDQAVKYSLDVYGKTLNEKKHGASGPGGGAGGTDLKRDRYEGEERNRIIGRVSRDFNVKAADEVSNFAQRALDKMATDTGMGQFGAFADWLKEESGKVVTDKEREQFMSAAGGFTGLKNKIDRWTDGGKFDPAYMGELKQLMETMLQSIKAQKTKAAEIAAGEAEGSGLSQRSVDVVGGHYSGTFKGSKPKGEDTRSDEDLVKAWKASRK